MSFEITITADYDGVKPKNFLTKNIDIPFYKLPKLLKDKRITINGKKIKQDTIFREGDVIKVWPNDLQPREKKLNFKEKKDLGMDVIFEDNDLLVLNKLPNVVVQGAQHNDMSLSLHLAYYQDKIKDFSDFEFFHVHRLDKDTSGVLVIAKNRIALRDLNQLFRTKQIKKKYIALVYGTLEEKTGQIDVFMKRNEQGIREKMSICNENDLDSKKSISIYKVLKEFEYKSENVSLVEIEIKTGITHQIRVHMKFLGCPIVGDKMYGNTQINSTFSSILKRQFLHAREISFNYKNEDFKFIAEYTQDLQNCLDSIK